MRIQRLDICGFKSFMDRMTFVFDDGVTGVVGPNGCGKSNVVDAIRWVMGEQSAKHLRGKSMEDVIFNGSESHAPLSMSEVSLTFLNDGSTPLPPQYSGFPEITVTRRLFRNGDSEYLINKTTCRLLDITELFLGTGVGTKAYSIIEQGRIGLIVSSKPEDRRSMIEEAAGITKYKARRKAAERKMEYTQQNLLRVGDILGELGKRLESLNRQARKAEKYKALKTEMREIELHLSSLKHLELGVHARSTRAALEGLTAEEAQISTSIREGDETLTAERANLETEAAALAERAEQLLSAEHQLAAHDQRIEFVTREETETQARIQQALAEAETLRLQLEAADRERAAGEKELSELAEVIALDEAGMTRREGELREVSYAQGEAARRLESERAALVSVITSLAQHQSNLSNIGKQRVDLGARLARLGGESDTLRTQAGVIEAQRQQLQGQLDAARAKQALLGEQRTTGESALNEVREQFTENEAKLIGAREDLTEKRSRLNAMVDLARNYEGYDRGVRALMLKAGDDLAREGIEGIVADLLAATAPDYEKALEAALGQRLQAIVVHGREHAEAAIGYLRGESEGRGSFIPLDAASAATEVPAGASFEGYVAKAMDVVKYGAHLQGVVQALLGSTVLVRDLASAYAGAAQHPGAFTFVTLGGEVLDPRGIITGGTLEGPGAGALQRKREIQDLGDQVKTSEELVRLAQAAHQTLSQQAAELEASLKGLTAEGHSTDLAVVNQEKDLHRASEELSRFAERLDQVQHERDVLLRSEAELSAEEASSQGQSVAGEAERQTREGKVGAVSGELDGLRIQSEQVATELTQVKVKLAADAERRENLSRTLNRIAQARGEQVERELRLAAAVREGEQRVEVLAEGRATAQGERAQVSVKAEALRLEVGTAKTAYAEHQTTLADKDVALKALRRRLDEATAGKSELSLKERELQLSLVHLTEQIRERYALELDHEVHRFHTLPQPGPEKEERLIELRGQVERMGEINLTAIDEHAELSQRHEFLHAQKKDLDDSIVQLKGAIVKIDETSQERFKETFDLVNERFQIIFPRLFAGGKATLSMVEDPISREQGIEIFAQPPGKALKSVTLLSGGEKALTAVSMIFAIFLIKPTPFCLLDEVDAPLDDANVGRYNEMIREMSQQSQFILITHNKRTMEIADTLYGVTMEEPGVSKLVSVRLSQRESAAKAG